MAASTDLKFQTSTVVNARSHFLIQDVYAAFFSAFTSL